jgi:CheY-like chemotaxis protein
MGSELHVKSIVGQGTTFWFDIEFPVIDEHLVENSVQPRHPRITGFEGHTRKILLVDDNGRNRALLKDALSPLGFDIVEASTGHEALDAMKAFHPDLILMDLLMPGMDGFEATRRIRELEARYSILDTGIERAATSIQHPTSSIQHPIIIGVSASVSAQIQQESIEAGCNDFLAKPIQMDELLEKIQLHLNLTWKYAEAITSATQEEIVPPPQEKLVKLYQLARVGNVIRLREHLQELIMSDAQFLPFANKISQLADDLQLDEMEQFIQKYLEET